MIRLFIAFILLISSLNSYAYWSCAWPYRTEVSVQEVSGSSLADYQIKLEINAAALNASYNWTLDGFDLRVVDSDDLTQLDHWVEDWDQAGETAIVWVKVDSLLANENKTLYVYYGNEFADPLANIPFTFIEPGIKFHTRNSSADPVDKDDAFSEFDVAGDGNAGYGCTFITNFTGIDNEGTFGANSDFIAYSETFFEVQTGEEGTWGVRYGADFGGGGGLYVNVSILEEDWLNDIWWDNDWNNSEVLQGTIDLNEGYHKLEVIGAEGCCDGGITVQFQRPGGPWTTYSTSNIDIRSRACPVSDPVITFGAQVTASCPQPLASYRLDDGPWSGAADVIDQTTNFPGTMLGTITEIQNTQVCDGAQVDANNQGADVSAIQTGLDLDADVGAVGSFAFWVNLNNDWNDGSARKIMDASYLPSGASSEKYFYLDKLSGGNFDFRFEDSVDGDFTLQEPTGANRLSNQWYHITVTFDFPNSDFRIYVDETLVSGALVNTNGNPPITSGAIVDLNTIQFGDKIPSPSKGGTGRSADGIFDEINIYNSVLSISEIRGLMAKTRDCTVTVLPRACLGSFPNAVNSIKNRVINFGENAQVINNPDNILSAKTINKTSYSTLMTCDTVDCITGADEVKDVRPGNFQRTNVNNDVTVNFLGDTTIGTTTDEFDVLTVNFWGTLNFTNSTYSEFFIDSLVANSSSEINFAPGTYWINDLTVGADTVFNVLDGGPVRLYVNDVVSWSSDAVINSPGVGLQGNSDELVMYFYSQADFGYRTTISGAVFATQDINTNQEARIYGLLTGENVSLGINSQVHYDVNAYYGMSDIDWCENATATISSFNVIAPASGINCLPAPITVQVLDASGAVIPDYEGVLTLSNTPLHGDWSTAATANGTLDNGSDDDGAATYNMLAADAGEVSLFLKNTHPEISNISIESEGVTQTLTITYDAAGFVFSPTIADQISAKVSGTLSLSAVETDLVTGSCQALLLNDQTIEMAVECISPNNCGTGLNTISSTIIPTNPMGSISSYNGVSLNFGDSNSYTSNFTNTYSEAGSIRLWARYELLNDSGAGTGNYISGSSNNFVNVPAGFCIESSDSNWQCPIPGLSINCSAFKQAGDSFNLTVTAKQASGISTDYCSHNTTLNFANSVNLSHNLVAPTIADGGQAGGFSLTSINVLSGAGTTTASFDDMGVFNISAGGNSYLTANLPTNSSENIGRFLPASFNIISSTAASYDNGNSGFTYIGQLESDGSTGSISYLTEPDFTFEVRGFNNQALHNYITPLYSAPVASVNATSNIIGSLALPTALTVTAGLTAGSISGPDASDQFIYTFDSSDHFVFDRTANSLRASFNNDISLTVSNFIEPVDSIDLSASATIIGSGGPIYYGRIRIENAYGPETEAVPQIFKAEYFNGTQFVFNPLDNGTEYDLSDVNSIVVSDVGNASNNLQVGNSTISGEIADTGNLSNGIFNASWTVPINNRYGAYSFLYTVESWLKYDWNNSADGIDEDPAGTVNFGQFRGNDRVIYWKEINY